MAEDRALRGGNGMTEDMKRLCRYRLLALIRLNGLLRNARRLKKANQPDRVKLFVDEANETIEAFVEASHKTETLTKACICPHYQGVCSLDDYTVCYCSSDYEMCNKFREASNE